MPLADVLNQTPPASENASQTHVPRPKRGHEDAGSQDSVAIVNAKKARIDNASAPRLIPTPDQRSDITDGPRPDPYRTLPEPCKTFVQLRFQLCRFKGVYRVARVPLTFTFANLYMFVLYIFGWSGHHLHKSEVCTNAVMYSANWRRGEIKSFGIPLPAQPDRREDPRGWSEWIIQWSKREHEPAMRVVRVGDSKRYRGPYEFDSVTVKEDHEVTLGDLWNKDQSRNISRGYCTNREIGIRMLYDLGASWSVDITLDPTCKDTSHMIEMENALNLPRIIQAKGAPPIEDACDDVDGEIEPREKEVHYHLWNDELFARYLAGEVRSEARETELAVFFREQELARRAEERERREREESQDEREDSDESDDDEELEE